MPNPSELARTIDAPARAEQPAKASYSPLVIYNASTLDGFASAWVAHLAMRNVNAEFVGAALDIVFKVNVFGSRDVYALGMLIHEESQAEIERLCKSLIAIEATDGEAACCRTWQHFFSGHPAPWIVRCFDDDHAAPTTARELRAALDSYPRDFEVWDGLHQCENTEVLVIEGAAVLRYQEELVRRRGRG